MKRNCLSFIPVMMKVLLTFLASVLVSACPVSPSEKNSSSVLTNTYTLPAGTNVYYIVHNLTSGKYDLNIRADNLTATGSVNKDISGAIGKNQSFSADGTPFLLKKFGGFSGFAGKKEMSINRAASGAGIINYGDAPASWGANPVGNFETNFWVYDFTGNVYTQVTALLCAAGTNTNGFDQSGYSYAYIFVDVNEIANGHVNMDDVYEIATNFNGLNGIYNSETTLIGYEDGGGSTGNGGIDSNRNIYILIQDINDGWSPGSGNGFLGGYYDPANEFPDVDPANYRSSEKQLFVIDSYPGIYYPGLYHSVYSNAVTTLVHEFQHMINYNKKYLRDNWTSPSGVNEETWLNEGCSMLAEDIFSRFTPSGRRVFDDENRMSYYLGQPERALFYWNDYGNDVLCDYAKAYSFLAFLARNTSPLILHEIVSGAGANYTGIEAVDKALAALGSAKNANQAYVAWRDAVIFNDMNSGSWKGYPSGSCGAYNLVSLDLAAYHVYESGYGTFPPGTGAILNYFRSASESFSFLPYQTRIFRGKVVSTGIVKIYTSGNSSLSIETIITNI